MSLKQTLTVGSAAIAISLTILPETIFLEKFRKLKAKYRTNGTEEPIKEILQQKFQDVLNDLNLLPVHREKLRIFHVYGYDAYHAGSIRGLYGAVIGIPTHFEYKNVESIDRDNVFIFPTSIDWNDSVTKIFLNSLILSDNAQKFAIAREILKLRNGELFYLSTELAFHIIVLVTIYEILYRILNLSKKNWLQALVISTIVVVGSVTWIAIKNTLLYEFDTTVDEQLSELNKDYIQGGKEFYEKLLRRNIALRELLGKNGKTLYTANGNENYIIIQKSAPIYHKKSFFEKKLQKIQHFA